MTRTKRPWLCSSLDDVRRGLPRLVRRSLAISLPWLALAGASARAQEQCVPAELVSALLGASDLEGGVFVGSVPQGIADDLPLPAGARVVGGSNRDGFLNVVAHLDAEPSAIEREIAGVLAQAGWKPREEGQVETGGFQRAPVIARQQPYCGPHGEMAHYTAYARKGGGTALRITRTPKMPGMGPCDARGVPRHMDRGPMPTLVPSSEMSFRGSGSCGGMGRHTTSTVLVTEDTPAAILVSFTDQLAAQGWALDSELVGETMGAQMWSHVDAEGTAWRGILFTSSLSEDTRDLSFSIAARRE